MASSPANRSLVAPSGWQGRRIVLAGRVQGVGFRPFVYRLATECGLTGWVQNRSGQVVLEVDGHTRSLDAFERRLLSEAPSLARPELLATERIERRGWQGFRIDDSSAEKTGLPATALVIPPDIALCEACWRELWDPADRRYRYPFINCTQCGPRHTIIVALPYDRVRTSMRAFPLCAECDAEYRDPLDRRFHAEPVACARCGPTLELESQGGAVRGNEAALGAALELLREGGVIAVQGIGGYHLMCDARSSRAVQRLRAGKQRASQPFALLAPSPAGDRLAGARALISMDALVARALLEPAHPIVIARRAAHSGVAPEVAPGLAELGVMLPYSPLHALLVNDFGGPLVATSGNTSGVPLSFTRQQAEEHLGALAGGMLHHDRPILRPVDDAVVRVIAGVPRLLRLGRGQAHLELCLPRRLSAPVLAVGGHSKNTVALAWEDRAVVSPHLGDLSTPRALDAFERTIADMQQLFGVQPEHVLTDAHPDYAGSRWAARQPLPVHRIYHHHAHAAALAGEVPEVRRWLVFTWDGVGLGADGTLWGGEGFVGSPGAWRHVASFRPWRIVGASRAGREPWRSAAALCWEGGRELPFATPGIEVARHAWRQNLGCATTSAVGRLCDAAAALVLGRQQYDHEAQGPTELEALAAPGAEPVELELEADGSGVVRANWAPLLDWLTDTRLSAERRASVFHATLVDVAVRQVQRLRADHEFEAVGLVGGVFQNELLSNGIVERLRQAGIAVHLPARLPLGDGGLSYGQVVEYLAAHVAR